MMSGLAKRVLGASSRLSGSLFKRSYPMQENFLKVFLNFEKCALSSKFAYLRVVVLASSKKDVCPLDIK